MVVVLGGGGSGKLAIFLLNSFIVLSIFSISPVGRVSYIHWLIVRNIKLCLWLVLDVRPCPHVCGYF